MSQPRPKPWEVSSGTSSAAASGQQTQISSTDSTTATTSTLPSSSIPELPSKPTSLSSDSSNLSSTSSYSPYGTSSTSMYGNGMSSYGGLGGYGSSYGSGYGSYGGIGGMGGYGMGGYGMGGGYGGYGSRYGMGMGGVNGNPMGNNAFTQNTELTFQLIESIIGAVGGFAQMLEATYMATHSSFFTMISVLEQFGHLKNALGSLLGIFTLITWVKKLIAKITGNKDYLKLNAKEFKKFEHKQLKNSSSSSSSVAKSNRISLKPLLLFAAAIFGFPYLLKKLIAHLSMVQQQQQRQHQLDPTSLEFAKSLYDFNPEDKTIELELKKNDLVAILSKLDPVTGQESKWWKCRSRDGRIGFVPYNFLQIIKRDVKKIEIPRVGNEMTEEFKSTQMNS